MQISFHMKRCWLYNILSACMIVSACSVFADYVALNNVVYQSLDYIEATGSQWIVTDITPTCTDKVKMKFRLSSLAKTQALYCSRTTMTTNTFTAFFIDNVVRCDRNTNTSAKGGTQPALGEDTTLVADYKTRKFTVNGIEQNVLMADGSYSPGSVLMLFASHTQGRNLSEGVAAANTSNRGTYRLYYFELYASGSQTPKHMLMPVRRKSDSAVGLYDIIGGKFYGRATNSEAFIASPQPSITDVTAQQRYPWNGKVDISYTVTGDILGAAKRKALVTSFKVVAIDKVANETYTATALSGDRSLTQGMHKLVWDMDADGLSFKSSNVVFKVSCETTSAMYCVIDLSAGANASSYPVSYLASLPSGGFNVDEYKTTKLVLRRIEPGSFKMYDSNLSLCNVTLTKPFYIGLFEVTQKQCALVTGSDSSTYEGNLRPVDNISYSSIRGSSIKGGAWPKSSGVGATSFIAKLRARTGLDFDLPAEAQWAYVENTGRAEGSSKLYGRFSDNTSDGKGGYSQHTVVGSYLPDALGLYDMRGNVYELCLDWFDLSLEKNATDPKGPASGSYRVASGGSWKTSNSARSHECAYGADDSFGFRLARTLSK